MAKTSLGLLAVFCAFATTSAGASLPFAAVNDAFAPRVPRRPAGNARLLALNEMQAHPSSDAAATAATAPSMADPSAPAHAARRRHEHRRAPVH